MMITLLSQQYGTAETEIMMERKRHREGARQGEGSAECEHYSHGKNSAVSIERVGE